MRRFLKALVAAGSYIVGSYYFIHVPFSLWLWALHVLVSWPLWSLEMVAGHQLSCCPCRRRCKHRSWRLSQDDHHPNQPVVSPLFPLSKSGAQDRRSDSDEAELGELGHVQSGEVLVRDGTRLHFQFIEGESKDAPVMLLCNGLGGFRFLAFRPVIMHFGSKFTYITWDYRGLFGSEMPTSMRRLAVSEHAHDAAEVLRACGQAHADVVLGWSMGVQVGLEFALLYPEKATHLVLVNGAHGQVFHSAFQPMVRLPILHDITRAVAVYAATHPYILRILRSLALPLIPTAVRFYVWLLGSRLLKQSQFFGKRYVEKTLLDLLNHLCLDEKTMATYLWLFQELNAHSVFHLLGSIKQQTLLVSGLFDLLLPAYHMWEMERRMPHATHVCDRWSAHFTLLEHPEVVLQHLQTVLSQWGLLDQNLHASLASPKETTTLPSSNCVENCQPSCFKFGGRKQSQHRLAQTS
mmetsp:Transcript_5317/g.10842  ORF Transcript_5317/g.10842 Transcript_5317/m.10842 type:complete len:464 (-) Transcript_5317:195-1586(-)